MADPMRKTPPLQVIREGNPGKRPVSEGVRVPTAELSEPDWTDTFADVPGDQCAVNARCREVASREWRRVVPVLEFTAGIGAVDTTTLTDYCICVARIDQCERPDLGRGGALATPGLARAEPSRVRARTGLGRHGSGRGGE